MSDSIDRTQIDFELHLHAAIANAKVATEPKLAANGLCHNCQEELEEGRIFCDKDCSDDYHKRVNRR